MTVQVQEVEYCKLHAHYIAEPEVVQEKREEIIAKLKDSKVKVKGFPTPSTKKKNKKSKKPKNSLRDSRAFEKALETQYKKYIEKTVATELVSEAYDESLYETNVKPIGYPEVVNQHLDGNNFHCDLVFLHKPSFELKDYKEFTLPSPPDVNAAESAEKLIQSLREQHADVVPFSEQDSVDKSDSLTMDVRATVDGQEIESLSKKGMFYTLGQFTYPEFDTHLLGLKAGDEKTFEIKFPDEETINPELKGKLTKFEVTIHMGTKKILHPLDDDLAQKVGFDTFQELRKQAEATVSQKLDVEKQNYLASQVVNRLLENNKFEVPAWLVLMEAQRAAAAKNLKWDELQDEEILELNEEVEKSVRLSLILDEVRDNEPEAMFSESELIEHLKSHFIQQGHEDPDKLISQLAKNGSLLGHLARLKDEATIQWIVRSCEVTQ